jgi:hypothetical protein
MFSFFAALAAPFLHLPAPINQLITMFKMRLVNCYSQIYISDDLDHTLHDKISFVLSDRYYYCYFTVSYILY